MLEKFKVALLGVLMSATLLGGVYMYNQSLQTKVEKGELVLGTPLAALDYYPIVSKDNGYLALDNKKFVLAIDELSKSNNTRAIADLIYLGQSNNVSLVLDDDDKIRYAELLARSDLTGQKSIDQHKDKIFTIYKDIVNGIGKTFSGTGIEIVLHDTRNPLSSVVALQNPISGRRLGDSTTNFGIQLIKEYSKVNHRGNSFVSYPLQLKDGRGIKSSTIPLYNDEYGLVGFICINIDTSIFSGENNKVTIAQFINNFSAVVDSAKISELIENAKTRARNVKLNYVIEDKMDLNIEKLEKNRFELAKPLLVIKAKNGALACAYIAPETCNKTGEACAIVSGVSNYDDMLKAKVKAVSEFASKLGVEIGDTGKEALIKMNQGDKI